MSEFEYPTLLGLVRTVEVAEQCPQERHDYGTWDENDNPPTTGTCPTCGAEGLSVIGFFGDWGLSVGSVQNIARIAQDDLPNDAAGITYRPGSLRFTTVRKRKMVLAPHQRSMQIQLRWVTGGDGRFFYPAAAPEE